MLGRRMSARLKRGGKGGGAGAIAAELGIDLSPEELAGFKGLSAKDAAARLSAKLGGDESFASGLTEAISAAQAGKGQQAATLLNRTATQANSEVQKKMQEAQGKNSDPLEKIADKIGDGNKFLEALVKSNDAAKSLLSQISQNISPADAEKDKK